MQWRISNLESHFCFFPESHVALESPSHFFIQNNKISFLQLNLLSYKDSFSAFFLLHVVTNPQLETVKPRGLEKRQLTDPATFLWFSWTLQMSLLEFWAQVLPCPIYHLPRCMWSGHGTGLTRQTMPSVLVMFSSLRTRHILHQALILFFSKPLL